MWVKSFILDRKSQNVSAGTIYYYEAKLKVVVKFCNELGITQVDQFTPDHHRLLMLYLEDQGHNPGGRHAFFRAFKAFYRWWRLEAGKEHEPYLYNRAKAPKVPEKLMDPLSMEEVQQMLALCDSKTFLGARDKALLLFLLDTGVRASEALGVSLEDIDPDTFDVKIRFGKGGKERWVFMGTKTRRAIKDYLRKRHDSRSVLWVSNEGEPLTYFGMWSMIKRLASKAGVAKAGAHMIRRTNAVTMIENGADEFALQTELGHASITTTRRYVKQSRQALRRIHERSGPVDNQLGG
ncbi:MAG: tyrosine-type recombinase/integrase [Anaerolineaceae bacterium]|nr:tyrosine-type recombinase/integrase [Anaerolineaceae bacterium]